MPLPVMQNPLPTLTALHRAAQIVGGINMLAQLHVAGYFELALVPVRAGLSAVWSATASTDDHRPQINVGFAPFTLPDFPRPYRYATAYPYPEVMLYPDLPDRARWTRESWTGIVIDYDSIAAQDDVTAFIETISTEVFTLLRDLLPD